MLDGLQVAIEGLQNHGRIKVSTPIRRIDFKLLVKAVESPFKLVKAKIRVPEVEVHFWVPGIMLQYFLKNVNGILKLQLGLVNNTESLEDFHLIGERRQSQLIRPFLSC